MQQQKNYSENFEECVTKLFFNFIDAVLKEMVRLNGESIIVRKAIVDTVFTTHDGKQYKFRKGDHVMYYSPVMHLDPEVFEEPEVNF